MQGKPVQKINPVAALRDFLAAIRKGRIEPRADYVVTVVGKTAAQA